MRLRYITRLMMAVFCFICISFLYIGITTKQPVSLDYNLPIARSILSGEFLHIHSSNPYMYFPGASNSILSIFLFLHIPVNLFGLFSWICLFLVCKKLAQTYGFNHSVATIFAMSMCTTLSVVRTIGDQSIDKWLCFWFALCLILLEKPNRSIRFFLLLGFSFGMLIGTKYSGPLFFLPLLIVYGKSLLRYLNPVRFLLMSFTFSLVGLFWYIRNFILKDSPYYPANLPFFKGYPNFTQQDWMLWKIPFHYPQGVIPLLNAFLSEYLLWAFSIFFIIAFVIYVKRKHEILESHLSRILCLSFLTGIASLLLPVTPAYKIELFHIISDMRYLYIFVLTLMLSTFLIAKKYKKYSWIETISLVNVIPVFAFIPYQPKIVIIAALCSLIVYSRT